MAPRILLQNLVTRQILDWNVPLSGAEFTRTLSGPQGLDGDLPEGYPLHVKEWLSALWVEDSGNFLGGGIVTAVEHQDRALRVSCSGVASYASGMPWLAPREDLVDVDPLAVVRKVWSYLQAQPGGNLHMAVDATTSPVRIGEEEREVEFTTSEGDDVSFEAGPFRLNAVDTQNLGKALDDLAASTPFDFLEHTAWDGENIVHRLQLGYPTIGTRRTGHRYHTEENLAALPSVGYDEDTYASEVLLIGAGEGREAITAHVPATPTRLRRVAIVADKSLRSTKAALAAARAELASRSDQGTLGDLVVLDSPAAPLAQLAPGDTIYVQGPLPTGEVLDHWVRITEIAQRLDDLQAATLSVVPAT